MCVNAKDYAKVYGNFYIQLYSFAFETFYNYKSLDLFYNKFIKTDGHLKCIILNFLKIMQLKLIIQ